MHEVEIATWRPAGSAAQELSAWFLGGLPHLTDPTMLIDPQERHRIGSVTSATVSVECQVIVRGFEQLGVAFLDA